MKTRLTTLTLSLTFLLLYSAPTAAQTTTLPTERVNWAGWGFSPALTFRDNLQGRDLLLSEGDVVVDEAGNLRITKFANAVPALSLATYQTFAINSHVAIGPFINIIPSSTDLFDAAGAGVVVELRQKPDQMSMTIGLGVLVDLETIQLAEGYADGHPSPTAEPQFRRREEASLQIWVGVGF
jgi:hypothetical protein